MKPQTFADSVLTWFAHSGRHQLPWQEQPNPYRVWVSEIMLQQTQVSTVIPYFQRFMQAYPDVQALAATALDEVLHHWTGLGYYARARNMHRSAQLISTELNGEFPRSVEALCALPGIGRSTAGAILALGCDIRAPILDGNVKRVLCRYHRIAGWPDQSAVQKRLWSIAEASTPASDFGPYTQAMMDLGATVCTRSKPACHLCPLQSSCQAFATRSVADFPQRKPARSIPTRTTHMLMCCSAPGAVLLEKRPASGIWGGLWSLPEFDSHNELEAFCRSTLASDTLELQHWASLRHTFSHFHLQIHPVLLRNHALKPGVMESERWLWYPLQQPAAVGLAAPVKKLLQRLRTALTL
jgi:A/G-specific adenine glycosylase